MILSHSIRVARDQDVLAISTLILAGSAEGTGIEGTVEELNAWRNENASETLIRARIAQESSHVLVSEAQFNSNSLGLCGSGYASVSSLNEGYIGGLYCSVRNQGIGTELIENLVSWLHSEKISDIEMTIASKNSSMKYLANKLGFKNEGPLPPDFFYKEGTFEKWMFRS